MTSLLEISGDDIALLNDADLRSLIGRLCEADYRLAGLLPKGITWGGHQDASDGGLDVVVRSESTPPKNSFIPRRITGFQVKKPDMPRSKILQEMKSDGELKEEIRKLIHEQGAYIIISSGSSTAETAISNRLKAMNDAVQDEPNHNQLHLDFFDRGRIATWVRSHPSLVLWVRNKIGRSLQGWQSYGNWANTPTGIHDEYLLDDELRLFDGTGYGEGDSVLAGLNKLRQLLLSGGASLRLIGLSGVGKTRLVQALFDEKVGEHALNPTLAYYTDISDNPIPDAVFFANQLTALQEKAILIVDNCSPELHRQLTKICAQSLVSLLTIEYDIQDDLPEETDVFRLEPASTELIEKLLEKRFPLISPINASTMAEFAGGNARVAIALANTLKKGESLSTLRDEDLFKRLFYQKHHPNKDLEISAEVCSLVYSFNGVDDSATSELNFLAQLADKPTRMLYRDIQELMHRGLIQSRGVWRAVLPHAIANRLAKQAINSIPKNTIVKTFLTSGSERLLQSFTRRLGYLHDCDVAIEIADEWLKPDGWLGQANCNFDSLGLTVFKNIAPIVPEAVLSMLERAVSNNRDEVFVPEVDKNRREFIGVLRHLAYDPELFERSTKLLSRCALLEKPDINDSSSARSILKELFHIILSGTHAPLQTRANIANELANSDSQNEAELGLVLLEAALQTRIYTTYTSSFGARSRDLGYQPKSKQEICDWYEKFFDICTRIAISDKPGASNARRVLANNLPGLWLVGENNGQDFLQTLVSAATQIHQKQGWNEGWIAIRGVLRYDGREMSKESLDKLEQLEKSLRPTTLLEKARTYALTDRQLSFDLEDDYDYDKESEGVSHWKKVRRLTRELGAKVVQETETFEAILPELVANYSYRLWDFGAGLADGCKDIQKIWTMLYEQLEKTPPDRRQLSVLIGFLSSCASHDPSSYNAILDSLVEDELLGQSFPYFQIFPIDARGIERLHRSLDIDKAHVSSFRDIARGSHGDAVDDESLAALVQKIISKDGGLFIAVEILSTRFLRSNNESIEYSSRLIAIGCDVLSNFPYKYPHNRNNNLDYYLAQIAEVCLTGQPGIARNICQNLSGFQEYVISSFYPRLLGCLAKTHPYIFLDEFVGNKGFGFQIVSFDDVGQYDNSVGQIPENVLLQWCEKDLETRCLQLLSYLQPYGRPKDTDELSWKPVILSIIKKSPNVRAILAKIEKTIKPKSWSGSYADALEKRLVLFTALFNHSDPIVQDWAKKQHSQIQSIVEERRKNELKENKKRFERFE